MAEKDFWVDPDREAQGVLLSDRIKFYCENPDIKLIDPFEKKLMRPANYDLRVGDKYYLNGKENTISPEKPLEIPPNGFVHIKVRERVNIPFYMIAMYNLRTKQTIRGFLMGTGLQIDAGYKGHIYVPLFNFTDDTRVLNYEEELISIQFIKSTPFSKNPEALEGLKLNQIYTQTDAVLGFKNNECLRFGKGKFPEDRNFKSYLLDKDSSHQSAVFLLENRVKEMESLKEEIEEIIKEGKREINKKFNLNYIGMISITVAILIAWSAIFIDWKNDHLKFTETLTAINGKFSQSLSDFQFRMTGSLEKTNGLIMSSSSNQEVINKNNDSRFRELESKFDNSKDKKKPDPVKTNNPTTIDGKSSAK